MKVLVDARPLSTAYAERGIGYYVKNLVQRLPALAPGIRFEFLLLDEDARRFIPALPNTASRVIRYVTRRRWLEDPFRLRAEIKASGADLYHATVALGPLRDITLPFYPSVPVVATVHDLHVETLDDPHMRVYRREWRYRLERRALRKTAVVADSFHTMVMMEARGLIPRKGVRVIPVGYLERPLPALSKENRVLFLGDAPHKNPEAALNVFHALAVKYPDWTFTAVGNLKVRSSAPGIEITGVLSDAELDALFAKTRILFIPSLSEGFGVPILQAFAAGACVAASERASLPEVGGEAAVYFNPEDENEMREVLEQLMRETALRDLLVEKGTARLVREFTSKPVEGLIALYRKTVSRG
ncbi:MAG: glycosyltransferase [Fibrobacterota bacterium]